MQKQLAWKGCAVSAQENTENWSWEVVVLFGYLLFFRVCIYVALRRNTVTH